MIFRLLLIGGDIFPEDLFSHLPTYAETNKIPYVYVPSRFLLGGMCGLKRGASAVLVLEGVDETKKDLKKISEKIMSNHPYMQ